MSRHIGSSKSYKSHKINEPYILKKYNDVYFVYKPPFWCCSTGLEYLSQIKKNNTKFILSWIPKNLKIAKSINNMDFQYGLLNRIDYETSGIIMVARDEQSYIKYKTNINNHVKTNKLYITLVNGNIPHLFGIIALPLLTDDKGTTYVDEPNGKYSYTEYIKLKRLSYKGDIYTLIMAKIKTGKHHQVRVHMKSIGHPVICDKKYESIRTLKKNCRNLVNRLFLHSYYYKIDDDVDALAILPNDLTKTLNKMTLMYEFNTIDSAMDILKSNTVSNIFAKPFKIYPFILNKDTALDEDE